MSEIVPRQHTRVAVKIGASFFTDEGDVDGQVIDLGLGGLAVLTDKAFEIEDTTLLSITITLSNGSSNTLLISARLAYVNTTPEGVVSGLKFEALTSSERDFLNSYISEHAA